MKNLKNTLSAAALMMVLGVGAVSAKTGLLISDRTSNQQCTVKNNLLAKLAGIIIIGMPSFDGIIIVDRQACQNTDKTGLLISDRDGIIIVDKK